MPTWLHSSGHTVGLSHAAAATDYLSVLGRAGGNSNEWRTQMMVRDSYTWSKLGVRVIANATTSASTARSRIGGINGNQVVNIGAGLTGYFEDGVNSDAIVSGNLINWSLVVGATAAITISAVACSLATAANTTPILGAAEVSLIGVLPGVTTYNPLVGRIRFNATEAASQYTFRAASTLSNFSALCGWNGSDGITTVRLRKNTANGNGVVTFAAGITGIAEDAVNTDIIAVADLVNISVNNAGAAGDIEFAVFWAKSNSAGRQVATSHATDDNYVGFGTTRYMTPEGSGQDYTATETSAQIENPAAGVARNLLVRVGFNTLDGAATFTLRVNTADSALTLSVAAGVTGVAEDTVNSVVLAANDVLDYEITAGGAAGNIQSRLLGFQLNQPAVAAANPKGSVVPTAMMVGAR